MSSWKALAWAKDQTVGSHVGKLLLLLLCEKVNERFELYPSKRQLATEAELGRNAVRVRQDTLSADGFLTVIERVRANGAQARSTVLVNHPEAPHMNGKPVVLDFQAKHLYPKDPEALRAAGIEWVAGGTLNATRDGNGNTAVQRGGSDEAPGGALTKPRGGSDEAPPGGSDEAPLSFPQELPTQTNQRVGSSSDVSAPSETGWLVGEDEPDNTEQGSRLPSNTPIQADEAQKPSQQPRTAARSGQTNPTPSGGDSGAHGGTQRPNTDGAALLRRIGLHPQAIADWTPTVDRALAALGREAVTEQLSDPSGQVRNLAAACITTRLPALAAQLEQSQRSTRPNRPSSPCGGCEARPGDPIAARITTDGRRCPACHPYSDGPSVAAAGAERREKQAASPETVAAAMQRMRPLLQQARQAAARV